MKAILIKNGVYVGVDTNVDKSLDSSKIQEDKDLVVSVSYNKATLFGGRVKIYYYINTGWEMSVDGIRIAYLYDSSSDGTYFDLSFENVVSCLNQMQQLGVDTFLANYKQALEKSKEELTGMCDKLEGELSVREDEEKARQLRRLRAVVIQMVVVLFGLMVDVNVGLDNHDYVDAYNEIANEYSVD